MNFNCQFCQNKLSLTERRDSIDEGFIDWHSDKLECKYCISSVLEFGISNPTHLSRVMVVFDEDNQSLSELSFILEPELYLVSISYVAKFTDIAQYVKYDSEKHKNLSNGSVLINADGLTLNRVMVIDEIIDFMDPNLINNIKLWATFQ